MILNITQHDPTPEQRAAGVVNPDESIRHLLTVEREILVASPAVRAEALEARIGHIMSCLYRQLAGLRKARMERALSTEGDIARDQAMAEPVCSAMVGGAPYLVERLIPRLKEAGVRPVYALSERVSQEVEGESGVVKKVATFRHLGFIDAA